MARRRHIQPPPHVQLAIMGKQPKAKQPSGGAWPRLAAAAVLLIGSMAAWAVWSSGMLGSGPAAATSDQAAIDALLRWVEARGGKMVSAAMQGSGGLKGGLIGAAHSSLTRTARRRRHRPPPAAPLGVCGQGLPHLPPWRVCSRGAEARRCGDERAL